MTDGVYNGMPAASCLTWSGGWPAVRGQRGR